MRRSLLIASAVTIALSPALSDAGNHKDKPTNKGNGNQYSIGKNCPPGLAKKSPRCIPPGQAKKYRRGDYIDGDYDVLWNPERYGLRRGDTYYRVGDQVYRVNRETRQVLDLIGALDAMQD